MSLFDNISNILNTGANFALTEKGIGDLRSAGSGMQANLGNLASQIRQDTQFKPYTVTSGLGTTSTGPEGAQTQFSPEIQQLIQQLTGAAGGMFGNAAQPIDSRAMTLTQQLEAAAAPSRDRERLALEERLLGQGRLGVQTSMFGGTPEGLAMEKAIEEQRLNNAILGRQQAMGEQLQDYNLGAGMFQQSMLPISMQNQSTQAAMPFAEMRTRLGLQGAVTGAELGSTGAEVGMNTELLANALRQTQLQGIINSLLQPAEGNQSSLFSGMLSKIFS
jgi:hypothetical protein